MVITDNNKLIEASIATVKIILISSLSSGICSFIVGLFLGMMCLILIKGCIKRKQQSGTTRESGSEAVQPDPLYEDLFETQVESSRFNNLELNENVSYATKVIDS